MQKKKFSVDMPFQILMAILLFVFLISTATWLVLGIKPIYYAMISAFHIDETSGFSVDVIKANYDALIDYNMFWGPSKLVYPTFAMSTPAEIHFVEVKNIFVTMQFAAIGSLALLIPGAIYAKKRGLSAWPKIAAVISIAVVAVVGFGLLFFWDQTFVLFHKIMFNNDFWIFNPATDPVIMILPDEVFLVDAALILVLTVLGLVGAVLAFGRKKNG